MTRRRVAPSRTRAASEGPDAPRTTAPRTPRATSRAGDAPYARGGRRRARPHGAGCGARRSARAARRSRRRRRQAAKPLGRRRHSRGRGQLAAAAAAASLLTSWCARIVIARSSRRPTWRARGARVAAPRAPQPRASPSRARPIVVVPRVPVGPRLEGRQRLAPCDAIVSARASSEPGACVRQEAELAERRGGSASLAFSRAGTTNYRRTNSHVVSA